jgi:transcriptional regulator with AAA-type ATPase domain
MADTTGMDILELSLRGERVACWAVGERAVEIGSALGCDVVVDDAALAPRHLVVLRRHGSVVAFDVSASKRERAIEHVLPLDRDIALGDKYTLRRQQLQPKVAPSGGEPTTEASANIRVPPTRFCLLIGRGGDVRRIVVGESLLEIGRGSESDVIVPDASVSQRHLRLEPCEAGLGLRDLGSRNGTFVNGVRVHTAMVTEGAVVRIGRTDLRLTGRVDEGSTTTPTIVAESSSMLAVLGDVQRHAKLSWPVLVVGESGTGKEGLALALHEGGPRRAKRFVAVNAGGLPRELVESELFGHEKGAFTGAMGTHKGVFEQAHGGTLFLDEIGELPLDLQARLLRVLETGEIRRVGSESSILVDVRLVCATHRDLRRMIAEGRFRQDLYYRIARLVVDVPALRSRPEDVRALARHFLRQIVSEIGPRELSSDALTRLCAYEWPGNARELRNVLCTAAATAGARIESSDVDRALSSVAGGSSHVVPREVLLRTVAEHSGNLTAAARALGIPRTTLRDRLRSAA